MPKFRVEQCETYVNTWEVEAKNQADAILAVFSGNGNHISTEYIKTNDNMGMDLENISEEEIEILKFNGYDVIPNIRSVEKIE